MSAIFAAVEGERSGIPALRDAAPGARETARPSRTRGAFAGDVSGENSSKLILKGVWRGLYTPFHPTAQKLFQVEQPAAITINTSAATCLSFAY